MMIDLPMLTPYLKERSFTIDISKAKNNHVLKNIIYGINPPPLKSPSQLKFFVQINTLLCNELLCQPLMLHER